MTSEVDRPKDQYTVEEIAKAFDTPAEDLKRYAESRSSNPLRDALEEWDRLADAHAAIKRDGGDFGDILTRRGIAMEALIHAVRNAVRTTDETAVTPDDSSAAP